MSQIYNPYGQIGIDPVTTTTTTCSPNLVSVPLSAGQSFILPPGATLIGASDKTKLQSDCADLLNLEELECYIIPLNAADNGPENELRVWSNDTTKLVGINVGNTFYNFGIGVGTWIADSGEVFTWQIQNWINNHPILKNTLTCGGNASTGDTGGRGGGGTLCFKTFPSIASTIHIMVETNIEGIFSRGLFEARLLSSYDVPDKCSCSC